MLVDIHLEKESPDNIETTMCKSCLERAQETRLFDVVVSVNWALDYDLGTLVSHLLAK